MANAQTQRLQGIKSRKHSAGIGILNKAVRIQFWGFTYAAVINSRNRGDVR
jgi:hypothetical protein